MLRVVLAVFLASTATLMVELLLTRVFDVILDQNLAYMIITCAMFGFGLAGVYVALRPTPGPSGLRPFAARITLVFALMCLLLLPLFNWLPFDYERFDKQPLVQALSFMGMYLALILPFFLSGLLFTAVFSAYAARIQMLYFWDLTGAALGCVVLIPFLPHIGPGGLLFLCAGLGLLASALMTERKAWAVGCVVAAIVCAAVPFIRAPEYFDFREHTAKRGVAEARAAHTVEFSRWDPISKIDVHDSIKEGLARPVHRKHVAYDGGSQSTHIYPFDGDFTALRENLSEKLMYHFWQRGVLASHYLLEGSGHRVLVIGSAGGQEVKAALLFGASEVVGVEMVGTVVDLGKNCYGEYNGGIYHDPRVTLHVGEGRSFLRSNPERFDVIQIFSNHTTSSLASGSGAVGAIYLQTMEAYEEYFSHLTDNGILHINHHVYPRMITTAAAAWKKMGRTDFRKHVLVYQRDRRDYLPTTLIKNQPWTQAEIDRLHELFQMPVELEERVYTLIENPLDPSSSFLSDAFYEGEMPSDLIARVPFYVSARTDDRPFFGFMRKKFRKLEPDPANFLNESTAGVLNSQLKTSARIPLDVAHLIVTGAVAILYVLGFVLIPLRFSSVGRSGWPGRLSSLVYFGCLGAGFILIELVFIQIFRKLIGFPLYTYSVVIFTMLWGAGSGSLMSEKMHITPRNRVWLPFVGILVTGLLAWLSYREVFDVFLASSLLVRCGVAAALIFPISFFLGMPFPLGILSLRRFPTGAIAWAWGMNGLFTVVGGFLSVVLALTLGFRMTLLVAFAIYVVAFFMLLRMRKASEEAPAGRLAEAAVGESG